MLHGSLIRDEEVIRLMRGPLIREKEVILARSIDLGQNANAAIFVFAYPNESLGNRCKLGVGLFPLKPFPHP